MRSNVNSKRRLRRRRG
jgi:hypothetical protein